MKTANHARWRSLALVSTFLFGCSVPEEDSTETTSLELNGVYTTGGNLTKKSFSQTNEELRKADTRAYYNRVRIGKDGQSGLNITTGLPTLSSFISFYGFGVASPRASYYNKGDLGIGRFMTCVDKINDVNDQQIACYVKNYAAGNKEFTFGQSANIAFKNLNADNEFATVAMVYRNLMPAGVQEDRVFFVVYDANGNLQDFAALDRHGFHATLNKPDVNGVLATPGVTYNNHIPSNCVACHGGNRYDAATHSQSGALFLPFDLDQFEYENVAGKRRADQLGAFRTLNEIVRKVGALSVLRNSNPAGQNIVNQLDGWYNNTHLTGVNTEIFENQFNSNFVPTGWDGSADARNVYRAVVRPTCRGCHMGIDGLAFNDETSFLNIAPVSVQDLCGYKMPHALQTLREFWQSSQPRALSDYLILKGQGAVAESLRNCGSRNVATLDPQKVMSSAALF
jgi:mono/diheme cytochrome c family protein